ncbi:MAG TPA: HD domain-containing protein [Verrucomicrobiae bacterium]|nr:HD domain-containing protein [Verrucomicrobiae bacterium]
MNSTSALEEVMALMQALEKEQHHVQHVARLAVHLFDELEDLHGLGDADRLVLESAALLHDIGWSAAPDGRGHHRESARLIREHTWQNFTAPTINVIAQIARYHRKSLPDLEHEDFAALSPRERERVQLLASMLRIADGLDRGHVQAVEYISAEILPGRVVIHLSGRPPLTKEIAAARRKCDLAKTVFHREFDLTSPAPR